MSVTNLDSLELSGSLTTGQGSVRFGSHVATAGDATADAATIATGLTTVAGFIVQILRSDVPVHTDPDISAAAGNLVVADGSTYAVTAGDVINWFAWGA